MRSSSTKSLSPVGHVRVHSAFSATIFAMEKISSPRERRKWSLSLGQHLKGAWPNVRTESKNCREIRNATITVSLAPSFLKLTNLGNNFSYGKLFFYLRLTVRIFQFLPLSTKFFGRFRIVCSLSTEIINSDVRGRSFGDKEKKLERGLGIACLHSPCTAFS